MQLSAELYAQIVKDLVSDGLGEFGRQQRREPRVGVRAKAYILPSLTAVVPVPVRVRDVSVGGMGLLLPREMGPDRLFLLLLPKNGGQPAVRLACMVAHSSPITEDLYAIGARFARWDEIATLGPEISCRSREWPSAHAPVKRRA
ncbi:MAG TPA: PilZ domain-containing protein [Tepidisphaeraceae bacterium]|nr:PilZ domain-containing protein [Tepidisphaeraceae bacterium]